MIKGRFSNHAGLSLLELLLALAIAGFLLLKAFPAMAGFIKNQRMNHQLQRLYQDIAYARAAAISSGQQTAICPSDVTAKCGSDRNWHSGWLIFHDSNYDQEYQENETLLRSAVSMDRIQAKSNGNRSAVRFYPNGTSPGSATTIRLCDHRGAEYGAVIVISNTGRIRKQLVRYGGTPIKCP